MNTDREPRTEESAEFRRVWDVLGRCGLVLLSDARLASVASLVAGAPVRGSWWGHRRGHAIWRVAFRLRHHPDVTDVKLVSGKVTYVHRNLWPALVAVGSAGESWQRAGMTRAARGLLATVRRKGEVRTDRLARPRGGKRKAVGEAPQTGAPRLRSGQAGQDARELEVRLLVHSEEVHTETGAHAKRLETWEHWAKRVGFPGKKMAAVRAKKELEQAVKALSAGSGARGQLPWE